MKRVFSAILTLFLAFAVAGPATQTDLEPLETNISVTIEMDTPMEEVRYGNPVRFRCVVSGLKKPYHIQWQYSHDTEDWFDLPCIAEVFEFILDEQNVDLYYRVVVRKSVETEQEESSGRDGTERS